MDATGSASEKNDEITGRHVPSAVLAVVVLLPQVLWVVSLAGTYVTQDFSCSALDQAGAESPGTTLATALIVANAVLLGFVAATGFYATRLARSATDRSARFLTWLAVALSVAFGFGIVMIAAPMFFLEICP